MLGPAGYMVVAHVILVSAQVLLVLTLGLRTLDFGLGLDKCHLEHILGTRSERNGDTYIRLSEGCELCN